MQGCLLLRDAGYFHEKGCANCGWSEQHLAVDQQIFDFITPNYEGFFAVLQPKKSWVAEYNQMQHCVAGAYAMEIYDDMPKTVLKFYTKNQIPYHRRQPLK